MNELSIKNAWKPSSGLPYSNYGEKTARQIQEETEARAANGLPTQTLLLGSPSYEEVKARKEWAASLTPAQRAEL